MDEQFRRRVDEIAKAKGAGRRPYEPKQLGSAVADFIALRGLNRPRGQAQLDELWTSVAGESIAGRTKVQGIKNGVLQVSVANTSLLSELAAFHKPSLLSAIQNEMTDGRISDIKFKLKTT